MSSDEPTLHHDDRMALVGDIQRLRRAYHDAQGRIQAATRPSPEREAELRGQIPLVRQAAAEAKAEATRLNALLVAAGQKATQLRAQAYAMEQELQGTSAQAVTTPQVKARLEVERLTTEWHELVNKAIAAGVMPNGARGRLPTKPTEE